MKAITEWSRPANVTEIKSFMVLASYYRRFVQDFLKIAFPLTNLLKKVNKFEWTEKYERVFQELRQHLTTSLILTLLVEGKKHTISNYASKNGLRCVLIQENKVLAYAPLTAQAL